MTPKHRADRDAVRFPRNRGRLAIGLPLLLLVLAALVALGQGEADLDPDIPRGNNPARDPSRVAALAFGSCNKVDLPQPLWRPILAHRPDLWIWIGDIVYADPPGTEEIRDLSGLRRMYAAQKDMEGYRDLRASTRILGVWDDHDYGKNDGGGEFPLKGGSRDLLLDFLDEPTDSPRRRRRGVYAAHEYGKSGPDGRDLRVLLLDCRWSKGDPEPDGELLGKEQWTWLERELARPARLLLLVSPITVLSDSAGKNGWSHHPRARERLFRLLGRSPAGRILILTGDRHFAQVLERGVPGRREPLAEVVASGMTHYEEGPIAPDPYRVAGPYADLHFGRLEIDWSARPPGVTAEIRDRNDTARIRWRSGGRPPGRGSGGGGGA